MGVDDGVVDLVGWRGNSVRNRCRKKGTQYIRVAGDRALLERDRFAVDFGYGFSERPA